MRVGFAALAAVLVSLSSAAWAGAETYEFDTVHTSPTFKVRHFFTKVTGRFDDFSGVVSWDAHDPTRSSVELTIQIASVNTGNDKRDGHLKSPDFFDAENHPTLTFRSRKIEKTDREHHFKVHGDLTIRGVTQSVVVDLEVLGFAEMPGMGTRGGFLASTTIDRQDYGVSWSRKLDNGGVVLADEVEIEFPIEVVKKTS
jgi:polyisoprenoid-binding protein YceI